MRVMKGSEQNSRSRLNCWIRSVYLIAIHEQSRQLSSNGSNLPRVDMSARAPNDGSDLAHHVCLESVVVFLLIGAEFDKDGSNRLRRKLHDRLSVDLLVLSMAHNANTSQFLGSRLNAGSGRGRKGYYPEVVFSNRLHGDLGDI